MTDLAKQDKLIAEKVEYVKPFFRTANKNVMKAQHALGEAALQIDNTYGKGGISSFVDALGVAGFDVSKSTVYRCRKFAETYSREEVSRIGEAGITWTAIAVENQSEDKALIMAAVKQIESGEARSTDFKRLVQGGKPEDEVTEVEVDLSATGEVGPDPVTANNSPSISELPESNSSNTWDSSDLRIPSPKETVKVSADMSVDDITKQLRRLTKYLETTTETFGTSLLVFDAISKLDDSGLADIADALVGYQNAFHNLVNSGGAIREKVAEYEVE